MRFDGYYVLSDWLEIPNLRERSNRFLKQVVSEHCLGIEVTQREPYMELWRRALFIGYAVLAYIYRWVVTFSILFFLYTWLKPYKLGTLSALLAIMALGSMIGWPLYHLFSGIQKRGRLPDMKPQRVWLSVGALATLLLLVLFLPLPVSRIRENALVQLQPGEMKPLYVPSPGGILEKLEVRNGQAVAAGEVLARFSSPDLENQLADARAKVEIAEQQIQTLDNMRGKIADARERSRLEAEITRLRTERDVNAERLPTMMQQQKDLVIKAPRGGIVYGLPPVDEVGKHWDPEQEQAFCSIGDATALRVLVPLRPDDYHLLEQNIVSLGGKEKLPVTIRVQGRGGNTWQGRISQLPEAVAKDVPPALTQKHGGPLAVKPSANPNQVELQVQHFLVGIDIVNPDLAICPGTAAQVKVHCQWRTAGWWIWHTISQTFDLGLW
jgi:putative peptide zinc metalloprotease protein